MKKDSPEIRKKVWYAIDTIAKGRKVGALAVKRYEIQQQFEISYADLDLAIIWLKAKGLIYRDEVSAGWFVVADVKPKKVCWEHGYTLPCKSCKRKYGKGGNANA